MIPSAFLRRTIARVAPQLHAGQILLSATKGIEDHTYLRMTEVIKSALGDTRPSHRPGHTIPIGAMSGPSFAHEVPEGLPTAVTVAFHDPTIATHIHIRLHRRPCVSTLSTDVVGVELGGALKNVIAIAAGVADGLGYGHNTRAALITRGLAEIARLAVACGGRPRRSPASPGWATWCSPARASSRATARLASNWARGANCLRLLPLGRQGR